MPKATTDDETVEVSCLYKLTYEIGGSNDISAVYLNDRIDVSTIVVKDAEDQTVTTAADITLNSDNTFTIILKDVIDAYGTYTVYIPGYVVGDDDADQSEFATGHANYATCFDYTITKKAANAGFSIYPEDDTTYPSLETFTLSSANGGSLSLNTSTATAQLCDEDGKLVAVGTLTENEDGTIGITLSDEIVASGDYTLIIPQNTLKVEDDNLNEEVLLYQLLFDYSVDGSLNITFSPAEEEETYSLSTITATFNEVDAVSVRSLVESISSAFFHIYKDAECNEPVLQSDGSPNYAYVTPISYEYSSTSGPKTGDNVLTLQLEAPILEDGTYYLLIETTDDSHTDATIVTFYNATSTIVNGSTVWNWTTSTMTKDYIATFVVSNPVASIDIAAVDPEANASVTTISELIFEASEDIYANDSLNTDDIVLTNTKNGKTYTAYSVYKVISASNQFGIEFEDVIAEAGVYTLSIPAGVVGDYTAYESKFDLGYVNKALTVSYTVTGPYTDYAITPAEGSYNSLSEFTLTYLPEGDGITLAYVDYPYLLDSDGSRVATFNGKSNDVAIVDSALVMTLAEKIVAMGSYTLVIPSYTIMVGNDGTEGYDDATYETVQYDLEYNFYVDGSLNVTFVPEDGSTVQELDTISVTWNDMETVEGQGTMLGINETYYYIYTDETLENKVFQSNGNANYAIANVWVGNTLWLDLAEEITEEGTYYLAITGNNTILNDGDVELTETIVATFTVFDPYKLYLTIEVEPTDPAAGDVEYVESILFHVVSDSAVYIVNDGFYDASGIVIYDADGNAVTTATSLSMEEGIANYFTVELADVITANGDYTIVIPEAILGDEDADRTGFSYGHANYEQSFTFSVLPKYYFKVAGEYQYLQRAGNRGIELTLGSVGTLFSKMENEDGSFYLQSADSKVAGASAIYVTGPTSAYCDNASAANAASWTLVEAEDDTYYIMNSDSNYLAGVYYEDATYGYGYYYIGSVTTTDEAPAFELIGREEYLETLAARLDDQAAAAATAAGLEVASVDELEEIVADYDATEIELSYDDFADIYTNGEAHASAAISDPTIEVYDGTGGAEQTISGLAAGLYKVEVNAMSRTFLQSSYAANAALADLSSDAAYIYANDAIDQTASYGDYEDYLNVNFISDFIAAAEEGAYAKVLYVYVADGEDLTIGFASPYRTNYQAPWTITANWAVTLLSEPVDDGVDGETETGISSISANGSFEPTAIYSVSGQLIRTQATSLDDLPQGIYIVNGQKVLVK